MPSTARTKAAPAKHKSTQSRTPAGRTRVEVDDDLCADGLLTIEQFAQFLGCGKSTAYLILSSGACPYLRLRADKRVPRRAAARYAASLIVRPDIA